MSDRTSRNDEPNGQHTADSAGYLGTLSEPAGYTAS